MNLLESLAQQFPTAKKQTLRRMIEDRRVTINGQIAGKANRIINDNDIVLVLRDSAITPPPATLPFRVVFEDQDVLVIDKPAGLLTSTVPHEPRQTALALMRDYLAQGDPAARLGLIHRLDRDASGLLVFSKNEEAYQSLKRQFFDHTVTRIYAAIVSPAPKKSQGRIESMLVEWADGSVRTTKARGRGQSAIMDFAVQSRDRDIALLKVTLATGRKHQIRAQLSEEGWPIVGDAMYGGKPNPTGLMLAAVELAFDHPRAKRRQSFKLDPTKRMQPLIGRFKDCGNLTQAGA